VQPLLQWKNNKLVASGIQYAMRMRHICHQWPVRLYNFLPHFMKATIFGNKKKIIEREIRVLIFSTGFE